MKLAYGGVCIIRVVKIPMILTKRVYEKRLLSAHSRLHKVVFMAAFHRSAVSLCNEVTLLYRSYLECRTFCVVEGVALYPGVLRGHTFGMTTSRLDVTYEARSSNAKVSDRCSTK